MDESSAGVAHGPARAPRADEQRRTGGGIAGALFVLAVVFAEVAARVLRRAAPAA